MNHDEVIKVGSAQLRRVECAMPARTAPSTFPRVHASPLSGSSKLNRTVLKQCMTTNLSLLTIYWMQTFLKGKICNNDLQMLTLLKDEGRLSNKLRNIANWTEEKVDSRSDKSKDYSV